MKNKCIVIIATLLFAIKGEAQDTTFLALDKLLKTVEATFPDVLKYESLNKAWSEKANSSTALMPPTFSAGINRFPYTFKGMDEMTPMNQAGLMFSLEQMISNPQKRNAKKEYYQSLGNVELQKAEWTKNELKTIAKKFYYQRQIAEKKLVLIEENEGLLKLIISTAESRYTYNQAELTNIYKAKAKLEELGNMRLMQKSMIAESNIGINTLLLRDINTAFSIDTALSLQAYSFRMDSVSRSDIRAMYSGIESMKKEQKYMASYSKPDFGVQLQHMQMFGMPEQFSVMGMMTIPIVPWSSKMYKSDVKSMQFQIQSMQKEVESMQLMAIQMQAEKFTMLQYSKEQLNNFRMSIIPSFEKNMDANLLAFRQNTGSFFVLLDAWDMLLMKKMEMYELWINTLNHEADYELEIEKK